MIRKLSKYKNLLKLINSTSKINKNKPLSKTTIDILKIIESKHQRQLYTNKFTIKDIVILDKYLSLNKHIFEKIKKYAKSNNFNINKFLDITKEHIKTVELNKKEFINETTRIKKQNKKLTKEINDIINQFKTLGLNINLIKEISRNLNRKLNTNTVLKILLEIKKLIESINENKRIHYIKKVIFLSKQNIKTKDGRNLLLEVLEKINKTKDSNKNRLMSILLTNIQSKPGKSKYKLYLK